jgi:ABC-2 type transport system ATP-binding protein
MTETVLALKDVSIQYGGRRVVDGVSFSIEPGIVYALLGRNGTGKSSLVRCLLGQQKPASGQAFLFGLSSWRHRAKLMERVGVVPEEPDAPPTMTAKQLSRFCSRLFPAWDAGEVRSRLRRLGVPLETPFSRLSKGERGSVLFALALGSRPALLVLDDPTLGLDPVARHELFGELIGELADRGTTVFVTTHDLASIEAIADRVGFLAGGRLAIDESLEELKRRFRRITYKNEITESRKEYGTELDRFEAIRVRVRGWGVDAVVSNFDESAFDEFRRQEGVTAANAAAMSIEEIFLAVAGDPADRKGTQ